ncbi:unnamed protein product [Agarophyton chilense]
MGYEREPSPRQKALSLDKRKVAIEAEMEAILSFLTAPGMPGVTGNLVDVEGFPRADIDVHKVRSQRQRLAILKTDHKVVSAEVEKQLHMALAPPGGNASSSTSEPRPVSQPEFTEPHDAASQAVPPDYVPRRPSFAKVDLVFQNSPAESAGVLVDDRIISFGAISLRSFATPALAMENLPGFLREQENQHVEVTVERGHADSPEVVTLSLTPRQWNGRGLLGCHVIRLETEEVDDRYRPDVATATQARSFPTSNS